MFARTFSQTQFYVHENIYMKYLHSHNTNVYKSVYKNVITNVFTFKQTFTKASTRTLSQTYLHSHERSKECYHKCTVSSRKYPPLFFVHYFEPKIGRGRLLEYSICLVHTPSPSVPCNNTCEVDNCYNCRSFLAEWQLH